MEALDLCQLFQLQLLFDFSIFFKQSATAFSDDAGEVDDHDDEKPGGETS